jgi:hypothetical protein
LFFAAPFLSVWSPTMPRKRSTFHEIPWKRKQGIISHNQRNLKKDQGVLGAVQGSYFVSDVRMFSRAF